MKRATNRPEIPDRTYPSASKGVLDSKRSVESEQTRSESYKLAFADDEFLLLDDMRGVRLQLEFRKPDLLQELHQIESTIVVFGSSRIPDRDAAEVMLRAQREALARQPESKSLQDRVRIAERALENSRFYDEARKLGRIVSSGCQDEGRCDFVVTTGGGPGIMEAANRGAHDVGAKSIGLNIVLPHEQAPNPFITPELCFQFHYFALRKMYFLLRAKALVCFPGGFGTLDELFEALTLIQVNKVEPIPVILLGRDYWERLIDFDFLVEEGTVASEDLEVFQFVETAEEAWSFICEFYSITTGASEA